MKEILPMNGGINKDSHPLYLDSNKGEVLSRKNMRVTSTYGSRGGINTSIKGMTRITATTAPALRYTYKTIGFTEDKEREQAFYFVYSASGTHQIYRVSGATVTSLQASGSVLAFQPTEVIDADIIGDYLVWVSNINPPRKVRIANDSGQNLNLLSKDAYDIQLAVRPPENKPSVQIASDTSRVVNKLTGKTFQFATMFIYDDYTYSVLSPYSDLVVSNASFSSPDNTWNNNSNGNHVLVTFDTGVDKNGVSKVRLLAREGNSGSWFIVGEYDNISADITVSFYNDVARQGLVESEALSLYSDVPILAETVKTVENRVVLANVLKGYDKTEPQFEISIEYQDVNVDGTTTNIPVTAGLLNPTDPDSEYYVELDLTGISPSAGDVVSVSLNGRYYHANGTDIWHFHWSYAFTYIVQPGDSLADVKSAIEWDMSNKDDSNIITYDYGNKTVGLDYTVWGGVGEIKADGVYLIFGLVWTETGDDGQGGGAGSYISQVFGSASYIELPEGVSTYKSGSYYNVGILFYDEFSRTSGVLSSRSVYVPHNGERAYANAYERVRFAFTLNETTAPSWAKYYRFAVTESVNFAGVYPFLLGNAGDNIINTYLDGKKVLAINMPTNLGYEFAKGDYIQIEVDTGASITNTITKNIIGTRDTVDISGTDTAGFWLIVPLYTEGYDDTQTIALYEEQIAYIYREKEQVENLVYFEDSNTYNVSSGVMQTASGYIDIGDAWYVSRKFEWGGGSPDSAEVTVEDFYLNRDSGIRAYSKGRAVVEFDSLGQNRLQDVVWSFPYLDNTKVNGISTFNSLNRKHLDEKDGSIQRLELAGFVLKAIQDNKETSLYIGKGEAVDAQGNIRIVQSNDFIGGVRASEEDYGTRHPLSVVQVDRNVYYFDKDKACVVRSSPNGQFPISSYGMVSEFLRIANALDDDDKVFAAFDRKNNEYFITFVIDSVPETWYFKEGADVWNFEAEYKDENNVAPDFHGSIGTQVYTFLDSGVFTHETNSIYNYFCGHQKSSLVKGVLNVQPSQDKILKSLKIDASDGAGVVITSPVTNTRTLGQKSVLYAGTWVEKDGAYYSAVFKNILTTAGDNINLIHSGTDMVGKYLELEFSDGGTDEFQLRLVTANFSLNNK